MKTPEEIKAILKQCMKGNCEECPYKTAAIHCADQMHADTLAYIEQLETKEVKAQYVSTCPRCAELIDGDPRYCPHCGQRVQRIMVGGASDARREADRTNRC